MADFNSNGGLEISPGPRGFSINGVETSPDGTIAYFTTDQPGVLNGIPLPRGPRGLRGDYGDPGEARIRVDETVGYRVFLWDTATAGENMIYGDTGQWLLDDGTTWVRRTGNSVESNAADPLTLPDGFRPTASGFTWQFLTSDPWPANRLGTMTVEPLTNRGLEGYDSALAHGFTGTVQQWIDMAYGVLPTNGSRGKYLSFGADGPEWGDLPRIGPGRWENVTLTADWKPSAGQSAQVRLNNGSVEFVGDVTYVGPTTTAGIWGTDFIRIGTMPPEFAPDAHVDVPIRTFKGLSGSAGTPVVARVDINTEGQIYLGAFDLAGSITLPVKANITKVNFGSITSYPLRNSSAEA